MEKESTHYEFRIIKVVFSAIILILRRRYEIRPFLWTKLTFVRPNFVFDSFISDLFSPVPKSQMKRKHRVIKIHMKPTFLKRKTLRQPQFTPMKESIIVINSFKLYLNRKSIQMATL